MVVCQTSDITMLVAHMMPQEYIFFFLEDFNSWYRAFNTSFTSTNQTMLMRICPLASLFQYLGSTDVQWTNCIFGWGVWQDWTPAKLPRWRLRVTLSDLFKSTSPYISSFCNACWYLPNDMKEKLRFPTKHEKNVVTFAETCNFQWFI